MSRVFEYRRAGWGDDDSVAMGLYRTGGIITSAGVIMVRTNGPTGGELAAG
jgi:hypothetical protein